jgi:hypothetical protein
LIAAIATKREAVVRTIVVSADFHDYPHDLERA